MQNYLYVEIDEEITTVIGKLRQFGAGQIFIVVPKGAIVAGSLVNLKLLEKEAKKLQKKLVFVSPDAHVRKLAEKAGLEIKRYINKPKEEQKNPAFSKENVVPVALPEETRKLTGWEEEEAKKELGSLIKSKQEPQSVVPPIIPVVAAVQAPPAFVPVPIAPEISSVVNTGPVDLRNLKKITQVPVGVFSAVKREKNNFLDQTPVGSKETEVKYEINQGKAAFESKKIVDQARRSVPLENVSGKPSEGKMDILKSRDTNETEREKKVKFAPSPFKTKTLRQVQIPGVSVVKLPNSQNSSDLNQKGMILQANLAENKVETASREIEVNKEVAEENPFFEKEMANLTLKEKERLKDLWMEQRGKIRSRFVKTSGEIDLKYEKEKSFKKAEIIGQEGMILKTTHQKVGGEGGKIVDLRNSGFPPGETLEERKEDTLTRDFPETKNSRKKLIILPIFNTKLFLIFLVGVLFALVLIVGIVLPSVEVKIKLKNLVSDLDVKAQVSGEVATSDLANNLIMGKPVHFKVKEEENFNATTESEAADKVSGQAVIYNKSKETLSLKAGALLKSSDGKRFITLSQVLVPGAKVTSTEASNSNSNNNSNSNSNANLNSNTNGNSEVTETTEPGSVVVNVEAEKGGKEFALKSGTFSVPGLAGGDFEGLVTGEVKKEITGGGTHRVKTVSKEDLEKAQASLREKAKADSASELQKSIQSNTEIPQNFKALPVQIAEESFSANKKEGDEADSFSAMLEVSFYALFINEEDVKNLTKNLLKETDRDKATFEVKDYVVDQSLPLENKMSINAKTSYKIAQEINLEEIKKQITARRKQEVINFFKDNQNIESFEINLWPSFLPNMPLIEKRVKVEEIK